MRNKTVGIALILLAIVIALMPGDYAIYAWIIGFFLGLIGLIVVLSNDSDNNDNEHKH